MTLLLNTFSLIVSLLLLASSTFYLLRSRSVYDSYVRRHKNHSSLLAERLTEPNPSIRKLYLVATPALIAFSALTTYVTITNWGG